MGECKNCGRKDTAVYCKPCMDQVMEDAPVHVMTDDELDRILTDMAINLDRLTEDK